MSTKPPMLPRSPRRVAIDCAVVFVLLALATLAFRPVFGGIAYLAAGLGGAVLGIVVAVVTSLRPLRSWLATLAGAVVAFLVFGPALAVPRNTIAGVLPTVDGFRELILGVVFSWKGLLTAEPPAEGFPSLLVVPYLTMLVCGALATVLAIRLPRRAGWAMLPTVLALAVGIVFGTKVANLPGLIGIVFVLTAVGWIAWRGRQERAALAAEIEVTNDDSGRGTAGRRRLLSAVAMLAAAGVVSGAASMVVDPQDRNVLRDVVEPPIDLHDFPSPLAGYRAWIKNYTDETLLEVSGIPSNTRLRIATLDYFNGQVYAVAGSEQSASSGEFSRIGDSIEPRQQGEHATIQIRSERYAGVWLPTAGYAQSIRFEGPRADTLQRSVNYNGATGSAIVLNGMQAGDAYTLDAIVPRTPTIEDLEGVAISDVAVPNPAVVPDLLQAWVAQHGTTEQTALGNITHMQQVLRSQFFSHGLESDKLDSLAGHGVYRLDRMFRADQLVGDDEQYAVAFALALHRINVPARVVMGFYLDDGFESGVNELTGDDMHAWVEIPFEGYGWVPFDATPPEDNTEVTLDPPPQPQPKPQVLQPPQPPEEPAELTPDSQPSTGEEEERDEEGGLWLVILSIVGTILGIVFLLLLPFLIVGWLRSRRRKRRYFAASQSDRLSGGWHEVVDRAVDLGLAVPAGVTRSEVATVVADRYPQSEAQAIGAYVDEGVFGPGDPDANEVDAFWKDVDRSVQAMGKEATRKQRLLSMLSLRSFFRSGRERKSRTTKQ